MMLWEIKRHPDRCLILCGRVTFSCYFIDVICQGGFPFRCACIRKGNFHCRSKCVSNSEKPVKSYTGYIRLSVLDENPAVGTRQFPFYRNEQSLPETKRFPDCSLENRTGNVISGMEQPFPLWVSFHPNRCFGVGYDNSCTEADIIHRILMVLLRFKRKNVLI